MQCLYLSTSATNPRGIITRKTNIEKSMLFASGWSRFSSVGPKIIFPLDPRAEKLVLALFSKFVTCGTCTVSRMRGENVDIL